MRQHTACVALVTVLSMAPSPAAGHEGTQQPALLPPPTPQPLDMLIRATVRRVVGSRVFTLEDRLAPDGELIVLAPDAEAMPVAGTTILAQGRLRLLTDVERTERRGWTDVDERMRETLAERLVLVATSLRTDTGRQLIPNPARVGSTKEVRRPTAREVARDPIDIKLHPAALGELIHVLGGKRVVLPNARVIAVLSPRAFLIESASALEPLVGNLDRLLVLVDAGELRVDEPTIVGSDVRVHGVARTLLGMQVTREVPWPAALTREVVERLEIRAAVLASSVETADGVELTQAVAP